MDRSGSAPPLLRLATAALLCALPACGDSLSAVDREAIGGINPTATLVGTIIVESAELLAADDTATVTLNFYLPPGDVALETHRLPWSGDYRVLFFHSDLCDWEFNITLWDGRRSEKQPVFEAPPQVCAGHMIGPSFWFS